MSDPQPSSAANAAMRPLGQQLPLALVATIVVSGYVAFLLAGFAGGLDSLPPASPPAPHSWRALPIYLFCGLLLVILTTLVQAKLPNGRRARVRLVYIGVISLFALIYAGVLVLFHGQERVVNNPLTYIVLNAAALVVFAADFVSRRLLNPLVGSRPFKLTGDQESPEFQAFAQRVQGLVGITADIGGLAAFCYIAWALLSLLSTGVLGLTVRVDFEQLSWMGVHHLQDVDLILGLAATALVGAFIVTLGLLLIGSDLPIRGQPGLFYRLLWRVSLFAVDEGLLSVRFVLGPLIWLIPALSIALFSQQVTTYFALASATPDGNLVDLFNPFSSASLQSVSMGLFAVLLGAIAVALVIGAGAFIEHDPEVLRRAIHLIGRAGQAAALTLAIFLFSLACVNAVAVLARLTDLRPFQLGAPTLMAVLAAVVFFLVDRVRTGKAGMRKP